MACGGNEDGFSCWTFSSGVWNKSHTLMNRRDLHSAWNSPIGVMLFGGEGGTLWSETLNDDGQSDVGIYLDEKVLSSCAIQLDAKVIISGGLLASKAVRAYNIDGLIGNEVLPDLEQGRANHGCGYYVNSDDVVVYVITGGFITPRETLSQYEFFQHVMSSTEILVSGAESWKKVGDLPIPLANLKGVSFNNKIMMIGGGNESGAQNIVVSFNITSEQWDHVGEMKEKRHSHGVSFFNTEDYPDYSDSGTDTNFCSE